MNPDPRISDLCDRIAETADPYEAARLSRKLLDIVDPPRRIVPKVKPLVWKVFPDTPFRLTYHTAEVGLGRYYQIVEPPPWASNGFALWTEAKDMEDPPSGTVNGTGYVTLEAAKAAAWAEWEAFVLAALETPPSSDLKPFDCGHIGFLSIYPRPDGSSQCTDCANAQRGFPSYGGITP